MSKPFVKIILKRLLSSVIILFLLVSFIFILLRIAPGDATQKFISPKLSPELKARIIQSFNLDKGIGEQYVTFLGNLAVGDFGVSYNYHQPVEVVIAEHLPFTIIFTLAGFACQFVLGFLLAVFTLRFADKKTDRVISRLSLVVYSVPTFVVGVILIFIFSVSLQLLPSSGLTSYNTYSMNFFQLFWEYAIHLILPVTALTLGGISVYYMYLRENIDEVYNKTFVLYLRSHGYTERTILYKHIIPNAVSPLISVAGVELGILFGGALITEVIFGLPGMGRLTIDAILSRDYPLVTGCSFMAGFFIIISNLAADLIKARIDKRIFTEIIN